HRGHAPLAAQPPSSCLQPLFAGQACLTPRLPTDGVEPSISGELFIFKALPFLDPLKHFKGALFYYQRVNTSYLVLQAMVMWGNDRRMEFVM
ncbi:hypothetical protein ACJX0J_015770, partial [Zea mays]